MYAVSQAYAPRLRESHPIVSRIDATRGLETTTLDVLNGSLTMSYTDAIRRAVQLEVVDTEARAFDEMEELLDPLLTVVTPYRGIVHADGTEETMPLGKLYITDLNVSERDGAPTWRLTGYDAAVRCQEPLSFPMGITAGTEISTAVMDLLSRRMPELSYRLAPTGHSSPVLVLREGVEPWGTARNLMATAGFDLVIDRSGYCTTSAPVVDAANLPVWSYVEGVNADFWDPSRNLRKDMYPNVVIVIGSNPMYPNVTGLAADMDPASRTYRYGPYGEHVKILQSDQVITSGQATAMATRALYRYLGPQDEVTFSAVANPALDVGDTVEVTRERLGMVGRRMVVTRIDLPFTADGGMNLSCQRLVFTGDEATSLEPPS